MATITGRHIINGVQVIEVLSDPSAGGGTAAPTGSIALVTSGSAYVKTASGATAWTQLSTGSGGTPAGSTGAVQFNNSGAFGADTSTLFWDNTAKALAVGVNTFVGDERLHVFNTGSANSLAVVEYGGTTKRAGVEVFSANGTFVETQAWGSAAAGTLAGITRADMASISMGAAGSGVALIDVQTNHPLVIGTNNLDRGRITNDGNWLVGTATSGARLVVDNGAVSESILVGRANTVDVLTLGVTGELSLAPTSGHAGDGLTLAGGALAAGKHGLNISATLPDVAPFQVGNLFTVTSSGTLANQYGHRFRLLSGYTGSGLSATILSENVVAGTGTNLIGSDSGNMSAYMTTYATTAGHNAAARLGAAYGAVNYGATALAGTAFIGDTDPASVANIGLIALARTNGSTPVAQVGLYAGLDIATPTFVSAALIADNANQTVPIIVARNNGTIKWSVINGGSSEFTSISTPSAPSAGFGRLYVDSADDHIKFRNSSTTYDLTSASVAIGGAISGGTAGRVLFEGAGPVLADNAALSFDGTNFGVGVSDPQFKGEFGKDGGTFRVQASAFSDSAGARGVFSMGRGRGTRASPTGVQGGDNLGSLIWFGQYDSTPGDQIAGVLIEAITTESFGASAAGTRLDFYTAANGGTIANRLSIDSTGLSSSGALSTGSGTFTVNSSGNITKINNVASSWPGSQGASNTFLKNDGSGNYSWATTPSTSPADSNGAIQFNNAGSFGGDASNLFWDNSSKALLVGTSSNPLSATLLVHKASSNRIVQTTDSDTCFFQARSFNATPLVAYIGQIAHGTEASPSIVANNDLALALHAYGHDGSAFQQLALIQYEVDGAPGSGSMPGRLSFWTTPSGGVSALKRLAILNNGSSEYTAITAPSAPSAGFGRLYVDSSNDHLSYKTSSTIYDLTAASLTIGSSTVGGGTAGRVLFEAAGPVVTDSAALTFDGANLVVANAANNSIEVRSTGSGTLSTLQVDNSTGGNTIITSYGSAFGTTRFGRLLDESTEILMQHNGGALVMGTFQSRDLVLGTHSIQAMTIDGSNQSVKIGSSGQAVIDNSGNVVTSGQFQSLSTGTGGNSAVQVTNSASSGADAVFQAFGNGIGGSLLGHTLAGSTAIYMQTGAGAFMLGTFTARDLILSTHNIAAITVDGSTQTVKVGSAGQFQVDNSGNMSTSGSATVAQSLATTSASPATMGATEDDYAGANNTSFARLTGAAITGTTITGFAAGVDGKRLMVVNVGSTTVTINSQDAGSAAANRIITTTAAPIVLVTDSITEFIYDATTARWRQIAAFG